MKSYEVFRTRHLQLYSRAKRTEEAEKLAHDLRENIDVLFKENRQWHSMIFGDRPVEPLFANRAIEVDDRECGEIPCMSLKFKRQGYTCNKWGNTSQYLCTMVLPKYAVFTPMQARVLFDAIREVLYFAAKKGE